MAQVPVITVTGWSNSGKTTFFTHVVQILTESGISVGVIKHHGHRSVEVDTEGKDTWKYEHAGANPVILATDKQYAVYVTTPERASREELVNRIADEVEFIVVEGFRSEADGAIELSRKATGKGPKLTPEERIALITDDEELAASVRAEGKPVFGLDDYEAVARYLCELAGVDPARVIGAGD
ncbi:MAG: molybdopterin-guanine dinucleotide biosynthesis protein B [Coriobacteriales bacterium]|jgi:molybdopterin-guanine dinucleotide biosynthesis protein MobB